ncbi:hypothetical protein [Alcanivorax sediminis]|uniref:Uncharacterized protein n=1 Tax=Alcanivorax sediminis TaxID=2663008 RepID=A0A6N7LSX2_9GAMM|nr:hypothetical protein [Alcanivorax sediminis]MQX53413.1 hypothetical protein [Alcanivorax sediminis]
MQQHYRRLARSATLILAVLLLAGPAVAQLCAEPGRDGSDPVGEVVNTYFTGPDSQILTAGTRTLVLSRARGASPLLAGDLGLLMQVQGATILTRNDARYGQLQDHKLHAEWVRIEQLEGSTLRVRAGGNGGGLIYSYVNQPADAKQGRLRWQLVRVPQYDSLSLQHDLKALPWDGFTGGVLALDVRRKLALNGHRLNVSAAGLRGAPALTLLGALGSPEDWRYASPGADDQKVAYGHHGSKGEGIAGTPVLLLPEEVGYPTGDMARGAPATAGGGGNALDLAHRALASGGGGGNGRAGQDGLPGSGGGKGGAKAPIGLVMGSGGGAAARNRGEGGDGGHGGGVALVRTAGLLGPGSLHLQGGDGVKAVKAGGGGGSGGTLWLDMPPGSLLPVTLNLQGGKGAAGGGAGGAGQRLMSAPQPWPSFDLFSLSGAQGGYQCRPAGHWVSGVVFEDNGGGDPAAAFNGMQDEGERALSGVAFVLLDSKGPKQDVVSGESGGISLRLSEAQSQGQAMSLTVMLPQDLLLAVVPDIQGVKGRRQGRQVSWPLMASPDRHSGPLNLGLLTLPTWQAPPTQRVEAGGKAVVTFRYRATLTGEVQFNSDSKAVSGLLMDRACSGNSERWNSGSSPRWAVKAGEELCVRVPVAVSDQPQSVAVTAMTYPSRAPSGFQLPVQQAETRLTITP